MCAHHGRTIHNFLGIGQKCIAYSKKVGVTVVLGAPTWVEHKTFSCLCFPLILVLLQGPVRGNHMIYSLRIPRLPRFLHMPETTRAQPMTSRRSQRLLTCAF